MEFGFSRWGIRDVGAKVLAGRLNGWQSCSPLIGEIRRPISTWYPKVMSQYSGPYGMRNSLTAGISWVVSGVVISLSEPRSPNRKRSRRFCLGSRQGRKQMYELNLWASGIFCCRV